MTQSARIFICDVLHSIVLGIAVCGMAGLAFDHEPLISWGRGPGMAMPTALSLALLALTRLLRG